MVSFQVVTLLTLLGSTGSIGTSTLDVVQRWPGRFGIYALAAGRNVELLARQIAQYKPKVAVVADQAALEGLCKLLKENGTPVPELACGPRSRVAVATAPEAGFVMSAIVGVEGLEATYEAVRLGKRVGLANKEVLVAAGELVTRRARERGAEILPVDSEHCALHQCLRSGSHAEVRRLILTASGGPFLNTPRKQLARITPEEALQHPVWKMGGRITIDSATLMNKGLEIIEAHWLFGFPEEKIAVIIHPESVVHSMIEFRD